MIKGVLTVVGKGLGRLPYAILWHRALFTVNYSTVITSTIKNESQDLPKDENLNEGSLPFAFCLPTKLFFGIVQQPRVINYRFGLTIVNKSDCEKLSSTKFK